jgi:acyl carrier protein
MDTRVRVREFLRRNFYLPAAVRLKDDASLLEQGVVDSTGVLELISFLEGTFSITVLEGETVPANLDSVDAIVAYVARKQGTEPPPIESLA